MKTMLALCLALFAFGTSHAHAAPASATEAAAQAKAQAAIADAFRSGQIDAQTAQDLELLQDAMTPVEFGELLWNLSKAAAAELGSLSWSTVKCIYDLGTYAKCPAYGISGGADAVEKCFVEEVTPRVKKNCANR